MGLLDEALSDDATVVRTASARALGRIVQDRHPSGGDPIDEVARVNWVVQRLLKLASENEEWGRGGALQGLALMGWPAAMSLDNFLDQREMRQATFNAVLALGTDGQATIERWLRHPKWRVRAWTAEAVGLHKGDALDVGALLGGVLQDDANAVAVAAARALEYRSRKDPTVLVAMAEGLATKHELAHRYLALGLQRTKILPKGAVSPILEQLAGIDADARSRLCKALGQATVHKDEAVSALLPQLESKSKEVRWAAAAGLAGLGKAPPAALPPLVESVQAGGRLTRPYKYVRAGLFAGGRKRWDHPGPLGPDAAAPALRLHGPRGAKALRNAMGAKPTAALVDALAGLGVHAKPELHALLANRDPEISRRAAVALAWLEEPTLASVPILLGCIEKRDTDEIIEEPVVSSAIDWHETALEALAAGGDKLLPAVLEELTVAGSADRARLQAALSDYIVAVGKSALTHLEGLRVHPELGAYADELEGRIEAEAKQAAAAKKAAEEKDETK